MYSPKELADLRDLLQRIASTIPIDDESTLSEVRPTDFTDGMIPLIEILTAINSDQTFSDQTKTIIGDLIRLQESINPKDLFLKSGMPGKKLTIGMNNLFPSIKANPSFYVHGENISQLYALTCNTHNPILAHYVVQYNLLSLQSNMLTMGQPFNIANSKLVFQTNFMELAYGK
jgi:hypothetical protein